MSDTEGVDTKGGRRQHFAHQHREVRHRRVITNVPRLARRLHPLVRLPLGVVRAAFRKILPRRVGGIEDPGFDEVAANRRARPPLPALAVHRGDVRVVFDEVLVHALAEAL